MTMYELIDVFTLVFIFRTDVDECATSIGEKCKYKCRNTPGSYECYCPAGYKLANFGSTCEGKFIANIVEVSTSVITVKPRV